LRFRNGRLGTEPMTPGVDTHVSTRSPRAHASSPKVRASGSGSARSECGYAENPNDGGAFVDATETTPATISIVTGGERGSSISLPTARSR
jgi:hypothetical protein